jgi:hypothetical protein
MILKCYKKSSTKIEFGEVRGRKGHIYQQSSSMCSRKAKKEAHFRRPSLKDLERVSFLERIVESRYYRKEV